MKCPKCGFVSYPGLLQCKKCGYSFQKAAPKEPLSSASDLLSEESPPKEPSPSPSPPSILGLNESARGVAEPIDIELPSPAPLEPSRAAPPQAELFTKPGDAAPGSDWREELSSRVEKFRERRARLRGDASENLGFDFDKADSLESVPELDDKVIEFPGGNVPLETGLASRLEEEPPLLESLPIEKADGSLRVLTSAAVEAGEVTLEPGPREVEPMEILMPDSGVSEAAAAQEMSPLAFPLAPLGRRFLAGLADATVLVLGASLFSLIFWRAGGHLTPQPLNLAVLGFIAVFFLMVYFGLFTALTSSTPGLLWMGLEVRNVDGNYPSTGEAFVRAFGYLVSISALMLGFLWAAVDGDGLTWHDRMSGTFITVATTK